MGAMQRAIDQLVAQGALKKGTSLKDYKPAETKKLQDSMPMAIVGSLNPGLKVSGSGPEKQIQAKAPTTKTTRRSTIMTSPQGLQADADIKRKKLYLGSET